MKECFVKTRVVILVSVLIALFLAGGLQYAVGLAAQPLHGMGIEFAPNQPQPAPTQPLPPPVETGANAPLVIAAVVILVIVVGGVVWSARQKKSKPADH